MSHDVMLKKRLLVELEWGMQRRERMWLFPGRSSLGVLKLYFFFPPNYLGTKERANLVRLVRGREELASALTFSSHLRETVVTGLVIPSSRSQNSEKPAREMRTGTCGVYLCINQRGTEWTDSFVFLTDTGK